MSRKDVSKKLDLLGVSAATMDKAIGIFSPKTALKRLQFRKAYDVIDRDRLRKKRSAQFGTFDSNLSYSDLAELRDIARDQGRNNPIARGILQIERNGVVGSGVKIQSRAADKKMREDLEASWKAKMIKSSCDVTGRFNFNKYLRTAFLSYRRDGDFLTVFTDQGLQPIEGEQLGSPMGLPNPKHFKVVNGVAYSNKTLKVIGYYIGQPNKWGYIKIDSFKKYKPGVVDHMFNPDRFSQSRGIPALTAGAIAIDMVGDYMEAELVAAKINACFCVFISRKSEYGVDLPPAATETESSGFDKQGNRYEKVNPGTIMYGEPDETAEGIGQVRPGKQFDSFINKNLAIAGRCVSMPLMLITGDFSGATFMNARIAYDQAREAWTEQQDIIVKPFVSRVWAWHVADEVAHGRLKQSQVEQALRHEIQCRRWPYVDPWKEAKADEQQLKNKTTSRKIICDRQGNEFDDIIEQLGDEEIKISDANLASTNTKDNNEQN